MNIGLGRPLKLGVKSLLLQKMRASLAALGIFIGTTTVIWLVAMGEGVSYQAQQQILELGARNIIIRTVDPGATDDSANSRVKKYGLLRKDFERIVLNCSRSRRGYRNARNALRVAVQEPRSGRPNWWGAAKSILT